MGAAFRKVKRPLMQTYREQRRGGEGKACSIMVTSSLPGEGKTFVALNLAISMAMERDSTVLLIDADTTRPTLTRMLDLASEPGLLDILVTSQADLEDALLPTSIEGLRILPAGTQRRHAAELLASDSMERLMQRFEAEYSNQICIFDSPPLLGAGESVVLAGHMGQVLVVVGADTTTHKTICTALASMESCPVVRVVLNKAAAAEDNYSYRG
jgi:protein-tyrosine kinase